MKSLKRKKLEIATRSVNLEAGQPTHGGELSQNKVWRPSLNSGARLRLIGKLNAFESQNFTLRSRNMLTLITFLVSIAINFFGVSGSIIVASDIFEKLLDMILQLFGSNTSDNQLHSATLCFAIIIIDHLTSQRLPT